MVDLLSMSCREKGPKVTNHGTLLFDLFTNAIEEELGAGNDEISLPAHALHLGAEVVVFRKVVYDKYFTN